MKELKDILADSIPTFFRHLVFIKSRDGIKKSVGSAYLREGQSMYTIRLHTYMNEKFFLLPHRIELGKFYIMTREPTKNPSSKNRYFWNIVGNAKLIPTDNLIELEFDLISQPIFLNISPDDSSHPSDEMFEANALNLAA